MFRPLSAYLSSRIIDRRDGHRHRVLDLYRHMVDADREASSDSRPVVDEDLAALLRHAAQNVPRYREVIDEPSKISGANAREYLAQMPVINRSEIQSDPSAFTASSATNPVTDSTGGSTGTPMRFLVDRETHMAREASLCWANSLAGWRPGEKIAMLWGSYSDVRSSTERLRSKARWWIENMVWLNAFDMDESRMREFHRRLTAFKPDYVVAYASAIHGYARYLRRSDIKPSYPRKAVISSAEVLAPDMRETVEGVFGVSVYDRYGNREFGAVAAECSAHAGLHINEHDVIVEIVDSPDPFNIPGRIVVTHLRNFAMPFIRYDTGDVGVLEPEEDCSCGRLTCRLKQVSGRRSDMIRAPDGRLIHGEYFTHLLYSYETIHRFQFIQEDTTKYKLVVAPRTAVNDALKERLRQDIRGALGPEAVLEVEAVDRIEPVASGKYRFTISRLTS